MPAIAVTHVSERSQSAAVAMSRTLLLATDFQQTLLNELDRSGPRGRAYTAYGAHGGKQTRFARLGFNGQVGERSTGCYPLGNGYRFYDPQLMRFHCPDRRSPFDKGGLNAYAYCIGDPVNFKDPTGEYPQFIATLIQRALGLGLHVVTPISVILGPRLSGAALGASRVSLFGSFTSGVGTAMQFAGNPAGAYVANAGVGVLLLGAAARGIMGLKAAHKSIPGAWKTLKANVKHLAGWKDAPKAAPPAQELFAVIPLPGALTEAPKTGLSASLELSSDAREIRTTQL